MKHAGLCTLWHLLHTVPNAGGVRGGWAAGSGSHAPPLRGGLLFRTHWAFHTFLISNTVKGNWAIALPPVCKCKRGDALFIP